MGDEGRYVRTTPDGGYIVAGQTDNGNSIWLLKFDTLGDTIWTRTFRPAGTLCVCWANDILQTEDGGYVLAGLIGDSVGYIRYPMFVLRTDSYGDSVWAGEYQFDSCGGTVDDIESTRDGGYVLVGWRYVSPGVTGGAVVKIDSLGNEVWKRSYGGSSGAIAEAVAVQQLPDGGFIIAGGTDMIAGKAVLLRTDSLGNEVWTRYFGGQWQSIFNTVYCVSGGYVAFGWTESYGAGGTDGWFVRTDTAGHELYRRTYGGPDEDGLAGWPDRDGGYILAGQTFSFGAGSSDAWLVKTDSGGNEQWSKTFGGTGFDWAGVVQPTADGGYVLTGEREMPVTGQDLYLIKTDHEGSAAITLGSSSGLPERKPRPEIQAPSPSRDGPRSVRYFLPHAGLARLTLVDVTGRRRAVVVSKRMSPGWHEACLPTELPDGSYVLRLEAAGGSARALVVLVGAEKAR
jgi:hypothetical protein